MYSYDQVFVLLEDCLISVKSGKRSPRNIADFTPDFNLWYALKNLRPKEVTVIENMDLSRSIQSIWFDCKIAYISEWIRGMTGIKKISYGYSYYGNWKYLYGFSNDKELLDFLRRPGKTLFIDRNNKNFKNYVKTKKDIEYITKKEFIDKYNKQKRDD